MSENQDVPKQTPNEETAAETGQQDSTISLSEASATNMEVHHHPNVEKKNFKEYFLEFIMIFLAVTLGFFAENLRENFSDYSKTNQFAKSLVSDLKEDTEACNNTLLNI